MQYVPVYYIGSYALSFRITGPDLAFYLLPILQAGSVFGRVLPVSEKQKTLLLKENWWLTEAQNFYADKTGPVNMLVPTAIATGILGLCWMAIKSKAGLIVFAILYGSGT